MGTNTGIGIGIGIPFKNNALGGDRPYLPPELKARLIGVWDNYGKKNTDADRNIIKNKIPNAGGDLEILNAAYEGMSGCNGYPVIFGTGKTWISEGYKKDDIYYIYTRTSTKYNITQIRISNSLFYTYIKSNGELNSDNKDIPSFKLKVTGLDYDRFYLVYYYLKSADVEVKNTFNILSDGIYELPKSFASNGSLTEIHSYIGLSFIKKSTSIPDVISNVNVTIEVLPEYEGAFVTDGVDDLITSTKTIQEMGITDEVTVVSMIHQIDKPSNFITTNNIRTSGSVVGRNAISLTDKTGIYGWYKDNIQGSTINVINNILGDKADYTADASSNTNLHSKFSVVGHIINDSIVETSQVAWYWTIIANKVLTTDQINQVIAYFNLDRTLKPDILCNTIKQGITNENHASFGDRLIDFSGNGRDIQLNNIAWKGNSGIGNYPVDFTSLTKTGRVDTITHNSISYSTGDRSYYIVYKGLSDKIDTPAFKIKIKGISLNVVYFYINSKGIRTSVVFNKDGVYELPTSYNSLYTGTEIYVSGLASDGGSGVITIIPSNAGALCLDGINDFGKVTGMPVYKDYTIIADYERFYLEPITGGRASILSKSSKVGDGSFVFNLEDQNGGKACYTFGEANGNISDDITRIIRYQSKYYNTKALSIGTAEDNDFMVLGKVREVDNRYFYGAIYSLMSFPYSMSKFLIERQLKKHKLGTLYPDMAEFRPIVESNVKYQDIIFRNTSTGEDLVAGQYYDLEAISIFIKPNNIDEVSNVRVNNTNAQFHSYDSNSGYYRYDVLINKSPQKINITIDEYIRYEDIVQPYPVLLRFKDESGKEVSWGDKIKVGSSITRIGLFNDCNLLKGIYTVSNAKLNGSPLPSTPHVVEKQMVFTCTATYLLDDNEPKCILSPSRLRIPNSSYKLLGYIPDISGHGNHGKINNSAYAEGSGVNEDGSYQFDGVDDFVTIPTVNGGKQVFMKVNVMTTTDKILYDQRNSEEGGYFSDNFAIMTSNSDSILAYAGRNPDGKTYIDGILNTNITCGQLLNITHNITALVGDNKPLGKGGVIIGASKTPALYCKAAVYDFMLFDEISTDDKIQELNEYVGIEAKVELPPYYWDTYGKTNSDADRDTIQQRGIAVGDYDLINYNHAYEGMSGYNGYPVVFGANKTWESLSGAYGYTSDVTNTTIHITHAEHAGNGLLFSYVKKDGALANIKEIPAFRVTIGGLEGNSKFGYRYLATEDATRETLVYLGNGTHELAKSFAPTEALLDLTRNVWVGIFITPMVGDEVVFDCDITIEVLPKYENGLAYDGITDYSKNANIPVLTDYTYIYKRTIINIPTNAATLLKGADKTNGGAFIADYGNKWQFNFGQHNIIQGIADGINWQTVNSFNGTSINKGENTDDGGITVAKFSNGYTSMVFYKLILYPKTISLLEINFLKNLMEKDEIIDLNNPIFIKNE